MLASSRPLGTTAIALCRRLLRASSPRAHDRDAQGVLARPAKPAVPSLCTKRPAQQPQRKALKNTAPTMAALEEGAPATQDEEVAAMFDLSKMKKKKKKKKVQEEETAKTDSKYANYTYDELLDRVAKIIQEKNPELGEKRRHTMKPPQLMRIGTKKTLWVNYAEICKAMNRSPEHVFQYFMAELGTDGSIDGTQRLIIKGKYMPKYIESLLRKYIVEYVTCQMCRSPQTSLTRDPVSRLYFLHCQNCGSSRSVTPIRAGFHAQTRADRRALRK